MVEHTPHHTVVECKVPALELADAVVALTVLHVEKTKVRKDPHEDGAVLARNLAIERVSGEHGHQPTCTTAVVVPDHILLGGVYLQDSLLQSLVNKFLLDKTVCYHIHC